MSLFSLCPSFVHSALHPFLLPPFPSLFSNPLMHFTSVFCPFCLLQMGVSELGAPWGSLVVLLQRLAATLATSSNHNSMELALLAIRNHVNDAILHAQLHGPRVTATVSRGDDGMEGEGVACF